MCRGEKPCWEFGSVCVRLPLFRVLPAAGGKNSSNDEGLGWIGMHLLEVSYCRRPGSATALAVASVISISQGSFCRGSLQQPSARPESGRISISSCTAASLRSATKLNS